VIGTYYNIVWTYLFGKDTSFKVSVLSVNSASAPLNIEVFADKQM